MQAKPEIQGIHQHIGLSLETETIETATRAAADTRQDESELIAAQEHQTETIQGSQVVCTINRMTQNEANFVEWW